VAGLLIVKVLQHPTQLGGKWKRSILFKKKTRDKKKHNNTYAANIVAKSALTSRAQGPLQEEIKILKIFD
jgi:hypothetical protein